MMILITTKRKGFWHVLKSLTWEEASTDETAEFKPFDLEKKKYVQTTLVELVDDSIVRVCCRRKKYPPRITFSCRKSLEAKAVQCVKRKLQLEPVCPHAVAELNKPLMMEKLVESCQDLTSQVKTVPDVLLKTDRLKKSTETCKNHKMTLSSGVLFNDSVVTPQENSLQSKLLIQLQ
ncbi:uncharacterized protein LOC125650275 isoform X2 [Ostrea edulis]|uniref:uncharacterized protein LOC125650275 isoform X2 n=1 Tax=Ostrea edulis TaxID=37623 RepID=UPI0024AF937B|nr:uncharacterized protein LOC125650275 isoform X2 [Ostrea edulis]